MVTDHAALKYLMNTKNPVSRVARWISYLMQFSFKIIHRSGDSHQNADALSRRDYDSLPTLSQIRLNEDASPYQILNSSVKRMLKNQRKDKSLNNMINYLRTDALPDKTVEAKAVILHCEDYFLDENGILYHIVQENKSPTGQIIEQLVIPDSLKIEVLSACHDDATGGHFGIDRTYATIKLRFFWIKMYQDVRHWIKSCTLCNTKKNPKPVKAELIPIPVEPYPFHRVSIDIVGPFPPTKPDKYKYICCFTDHMTKWPEAVCMKDVSAPTVARAIYEEIIFRYGCPSILQSERGTTFLSSLVLELCDIMNIKKATSSSFRPSKNGLVEN